MSEQQLRTEKDTVAEDKLGLSQLVYGTKYIDEGDGKEHTIFWDTFVPVTPVGKQEALSLLKPTENLLSSNVSDYADGKGKTEKYATGVKGVFLFKNYYKKEGSEDFVQKLEGYTRLGGE